MQKITNENGEEIEVFTAEEVESQRQSAIEEYRQLYPDESGELARIQGELQIKTGELAKLKEKDLNFSNLRQSKEKLEADIEGLKKTIDEKIGIAKKEVLEGVMKDYYIDTLKNLSGGDKELADKIEFHYKRISDPGATKGEVEKKLTDAFILATGEGKGKPISGAFSSGGVSGVGADKTQKFTDEEKALAQKLAKAGGLELKEEDFNK